MPRCPDCNRFVSVEAGEPEIMDDSIDEGNLTIALRLIKTCAECGNELEEATLEFDEFVEHKDHQNSLKTDTDDLETTDKTEGKGRGMKMFYGASVHVVVTCTECDFIKELDFSDFVQASHFDPLY